MTAPLKAIDGNADLPTLMTELATRARAAARVLALASRRPEERGAGGDGARRSARNAAAILAANAEDVADARATGASAAFIDRLTLTPARIDAMADGIATVREIPDPVGVVTESWQRPNGMMIERVRVPLGVVARDLRKPPQRRRRRRRAVPEIRQRRDPARRLRQFPLLPRDP